MQKFIFKPRHTSESHHNPNSQLHHQKSWTDGVQSGGNVRDGSWTNAKDRRSAYTRTNSHKNFSTSESSRRSKAAEAATELADDSQTAAAGQIGKNGHRRSTNSNGGKSARITSSSINSNGESFEYDDC